MTVLTDNARSLLRAPFALALGPARIGEALWLYVYSVANAMRTGHICRSRDHLMHELGIDDATLDSWLATLVATELVAVQSSGSYLVLKLRSWPGSNSFQAASSPQNEPDTSLEKTEQRNVPVAGSMLPAGKAIAGNAGKQGVDGGLGEGEGLLAEVQTVVALPDVSSLRDLLAKHPEAQIRDALARVARTPPSQIRKSRFALFRYLLAHPPQPSPHDSNSQNQP